LFCDLIFGDLCYPNMSEPISYAGSIKNYRLNCSFKPLTFTKLRFWLPKKKTTKRPPKFCICNSFGPQGQKKITCGTSLRVPRQRRPSQNCHWGPKLPQMQNLRGRFVVLFS